MRYQKAGKNSGRWDYIYSNIKKLGHRTELVQPDSAEASSSVGTLTIAHPVVVSGVVADPFGGIVPGASIRAWLPVKNEDGISRTVIQIGEAATDESGHYTSFLPPSIFQ